jgi:hypothetical protein
MNILTKLNNTLRISELKKYSIEEIAIALLLMVGIFISLFQFLSNRSLWVEEAMLALDIIHKNSFELLKPLEEYRQVAPILFLQIEKLFSTLLPDTEYGLRIFPLLCFWGAGYFFYKFIKKQLHSVYEIIIALSFFVLNGLFILYSSEVKQYMTDIFVLLIIFYLLIKSYKREQNKYYIVGITGVFSIFLSNIAPIVLFTVGLYLFYVDFFQLKQKKSDRILPLLAVFVVWLGVFSIYYYYFIYEHPNREFMIGFWSGEENAFMPYNSLKEFCNFISIRRAVILRALLPQITTMHPFFENAIQIMLLLMFLFGILCLILKKRIELIILTCTPLVLHAVLSASQLYPFALRLILYTLPGVIIICSIGIIFMLKLVFARLMEGKYHSLIFLFPVLLFLTGYPFKIRSQEIKESIKYILKNRKENENIYAHISCFAASAYYEAIGFAPPIEDIAFRPYDQTFTISQRTGDDKYIEELKKVHGKNWLLFTYYLEGEKYITDKLDSCYKRLKTFHTAGSSVYFYDFGE